MARWVTECRRAAVAVTVVALGSAIGCNAEKEPLVVYAGKGLKKAVEDIRQQYERREGERITVVYAGSNTLLTTFRTTHRGDVYIPGSPSYIDKAGDLVSWSRPVAMHVPVFAVQAESGLAAGGYAGLLAPGVRIAVGNRDMCAVGKIAGDILDGLDPAASFEANIVITGTTVNELLQLVIDGEVDAALVWQDMLLWPESRHLAPVPIPQGINRPKRIMVGVLAESEAPARARKLAEFIAEAGPSIFAVHGFGEP